MLTLVDSDKFKSSKCWLKLSSQIALSFKMSVVLPYNGYLFCTVSLEATQLAGQLKQKYPFSGKSTRNSQFINHIRQNDWHFDGNVSFLRRSCPFEQFHFVIHSIFLVATVTLTQTQTFMAPQRDPWKSNTLLTQQRMVRQC